MEKEVFSKTEKTIAKLITAVVVGWVLYERHKYIKTAKKEQEVLLDMQVVPDIDGIGAFEEYNPKKMFFDIISKKVNLNWYDSIMVFERGNRVVVVVAQRENLGGNAHYYQQNEITINLSTLYKREIFVDDLTTNGFVWISEYFKNI